MGFYTVGRNRNNEDVADISFEVWNPNVRNLYEALGLDNPYGTHFSGTGETMTFALERIEGAYSDAEKREFFSDAIRESLHPVVRLLSGGYPMTVDPKREKERLLRFLSECLEIASKEGTVTLYFS